MVTKPAKLAKADKPAIAPFPFPVPYYGDEVDDLTIEYPSSDGEPMAESDRQYTPMTYAVSSLRVRYHGREDVYIAGDMLMYYRMNDTRVSVAPDVYAVFGATGNHPRDTWLVWREGKAPDFVMEIASPGTWRRDVGVKREIYARMGTLEYVRFDPTGQCFTPALVIEYLDGFIYRERPVTLGADGILRGYSEVLGLEICVLPDLELRFYDPATGEWLLSHQEAEDALRAESEARQAEAEARRAAENALLASESENAQLREQLRLLQRQQPP